MYDVLPYAPDFEGGPSSGPLPRPARPGALRPPLIRRVGLVLLALALAVSLELGPVAKSRQAEAFVQVAVPVAVGYGLIALLGVWGVSTAALDASSAARLWGAFVDDYDYAMNSAARASVEFVSGAWEGGVEIVQNSVDVSRQDIDNLSAALASAAAEGSLSLDMFNAYASNGELNPYYFLALAFVDWLLAGGFKWYPTDAFDAWGVTYATQYFHAKQIGNLSLAGNMACTVHQPGQGGLLDGLLFDTCDNPDRWYYGGSYYFPVAKNAVLGKLYFAQMDFDTYFAYLCGDLAASVEASGFMSGWPSMTFPNSEGGICEVFAMDYGSLVSEMSYYPQFFTDLDDPYLFDALYGDSPISYWHEVEGYPFEVEQIWNETRDSFTTTELLLMPSAVDFGIADASHVSDTILNGFVSFAFYGALSRMLDWTGLSVTDNPDVLPNRDAWAGVEDALGVALGAAAGVAALGADAVVNGDYISNRGNAVFPPIPVSGAADKSNPYEGASSWSDVLSTSKTGVASDVWGRDISVTQDTTAAKVGEGAASTELVTDTVGELLKPDTGSSISLPSPAPVPVGGLDLALNNLGDSVSGKFPFCVPFWIADGISLLVATPEAPSFDFVFDTPVGRYTYRVDLSPYDSVAGIFRTMFNILFIFAVVRFVKLVWDTRKGATDD